MCSGVVVKKMQQDSTIEPFKCRHLSRVSSGAACRSSMFVIQRRAVTNKTVLYWYRRGPV